MARRTVRIRLDAKAERPDLRTGFRHANLKAWVRENHEWLVWSALTMIQAWIAAGRPRGRKILGMFEPWAETMGGILDVIRIPAAPSVTPKRKASSTAAISRPHPDTRPARTSVTKLSNSSVRLLAKQKRVCTPESAVIYNV
jgi:hypothetical protein